MMSAGPGDALGKLEETRGDYVKDDGLQGQLGHGQLGHGQHAKTGRCKQGRVAEIRKVIQKTCSEPQNLSKSLAKRFQQKLLGVG